jgi:hypothetical protein
VSNKALEKHCRKLSVPKPPRGYWAKLAHGKRVRVIPLGQLPEGTPSKTLIGITTDQSEARRSPGRRKRLYPSEIPDVQILDDLTGCEPIVTVTRRALEKSRTHYSDLHDVTREPGCLAVRVSLTQIDRALRILDALAKAMQARNRVSYLIEDAKTVSVLVLS